MYRRWYQKEIETRNLKNGKGLKAPCLEFFGMCWRGNFSLVVLLPSFLELVLLADLKILRKLVPLLHLGQDQAGSNAI